MLEVLAYQSVPPLDQNPHDSVLGKMISAAADGPGYADAAGRGADALVAAAANGGGEEAAAAWAEGGDAFAPVPPAYRDVPTIVYAHEQRMLKSEDLIFTEHVVDLAPGRCHSLFMVCDGHQGAGAAQHLVQTLPWLLAKTLPKELPDWGSDAAVQAFAEQIRRAISSSVVLADNRWTSTAQLAGTTLTLCIVSGWLVTVANTGDSSAVLDTGDSVSEITLSHRIQVNTDEQARLRSGGGTLAPLGFHLQGPAKPNEMGVGPLRLWPGGLCVSRSIGDLDAGPLVVPLPHVRQLLTPKDRVLRLFLASDGLWDLFSYEKAAKSVRNKLPHEAAASLAAAVVRDRRMADDMSVIVLDVSGEPGLQFPISALRAAAAKQASDPAPPPSGGGGLFACFRPPAPPPPPPAAGGGLPLVADVDCLEAYPMHTHNLTRASLEAGAVTLKGAPRKPNDYTVHGARASVFSSDASWSAGGPGTPGDSVHGAAGAASVHAGSIAGLGGSGSGGLEEGRGGGAFSSSTHGGALYAAHTGRAAARAAPPSQQQPPPLPLPPQAAAAGGPNAPQALGRVWTMPRPAGGEDGREVVRTSSAYIERDLPEPPPSGGAPSASTPAPAPAAGAGDDAGKE